MRPTNKLLFTAITLAALTAGVWSQTETASNSSPEKGYPAGAFAPTHAPVTGSDIDALKDTLAAQQQQIQALQEQLQRTNQALQQVLANPTNAAAKADAAQAQAGQLRTDVGALRTNVDLAAVDPQNAQGKTNDQEKDLGEPQNPLIETPLTIHFRGVSITPGGFAAGEFVRRSRALQADIATPFNSLTMPGASQSAISEFIGSARQSRPTIFIASRLRDVDLSSYLSGDFLSAGVTSTSTSTNSYTFRLRQVWGQAKFDHGWSILGGQMWTLLTENKYGIGPSDDAGKVNDARPATIDSTYNVGFTYARQYGLRLTRDFADRVWFAVSMENPQATLTTHGNAANFLLGESGATNSFNSTANYSFNPSPDIIAKLVFEPGFGHYEAFGVFSRFRDRVFPCVENYASAACGSLTAASVRGAYNASKDGGGVGVNARWTFANKRIVFGLHGFGGSGIGRYGAGQLSDVSVYADGTLHLIKGFQGLTTLEWHGQKLDVYLYSGSEYAGRTASFDPLANKGAGAEVGYGAPLFNNSGCYTETLPTSNSGFAPGTLANCTADTRVLIEGTGGFWYRFYSGPRGTLRFGTQYSYVTRNTWSGVGGEPHGIDNMVFTSFRYYLP